MSTYVCSDFHGFYSLYEQISHFIQPEDKVIFLGDAADRGPNGWKTIKAILDDPQWTYIMGNHDYMFVKSFMGPDRIENERLHYYNGGKVTRNQYLEDTEENRHNYIQLLTDCPYEMTYVNDYEQVIYMSHSGLVKSEWVDDYDLVWDRSHFRAPVPMNIDVIIHGHTTIPHLVDELKHLHYWYDSKDDPEPDEWDGPGHTYWYADGRKVDVDNCTITSGSCVLLNLDTWEEHSFFVDESEEDYIWED